MIHRKDTIVGPLVSKDQMETVLGYIEKGKEEGARVLIGGNKMDRKVIMSNLQYLLM